MQNTTSTNAKFPTRGKLLDFFIKTLEIENVNDADRKRYQRFISEENISIEEYNETLDLYIDRILDELVLDKTKYFSAKKATNEFLERYLSFIQKIEVYAYTQECINKILVKHIYLPFLTFFNQYYIGVDTNIFSSSDTNPLNDIFDIFKTKNNIDDKEFEQYLFEELDKITDESKTDKTLGQSILNWLNNKTFPNIKNIEYLSEIFSKKLSQSKDELKQYFMFAKLVDKSKVSKEIIFQGSLNITSEKELAKYIFRCEPQYQDILHLAVELYNLTNIEQEKTKEMEKKFNLVCIQLKEKGFNENEIPYIAWAKARLYAQKKEFKEATKYYELALVNGKNSMGKHYVDIVKEGLIVSAWATRENVLELKNPKSSFTKFYIEAYFSKLIDSPPDAINQYFLNDMKKKFSIYFTNLYPDTNINKATFKAYEHGIIYTPDLAKIKFDLKNPNKYIRDIYPNPMTQLMHFSHCIDYEKVKKLLDVGADVNITRFNDNGTALVMVLRESPEEKRQDVIKIAKLLISKMSKEALCAKLPKKKMTALGLAIDLGYVEIVKLLIEKGANVNQVIYIENVSPLYYTLKKIAEEKDDLFTFLKRMNLNRDEDILKIVNSMPSNHLFKQAIIDQEKIDTFKRLKEHNDTEDTKIKEAVAKYSLELLKKRKETYYQIFDLLLNAKPNLEIRLNGNMNTVLMLATEFNEVELVKKLLDAGADKNATIDDTINPHIKHTAKAFAIENKNKELIDLLS